MIKGLPFLRVALSSTQQAVNKARAEYLLPYNVRLLCFPKLQPSRYISKQRHGAAKMVGTRVGRQAGWLAGWLAGSALALFQNTNALNTLNVPRASIGIKGQG